MGSEEHIKFGKANSCTDFGENPVTFDNIVASPVHKTHCEKLGPSLQQCWQHQSVGALYYAEPQLALVLPI